MRVLQWPRGFIFLAALLTDSLFSGPERDKHHTVAVCVWLLSKVHCEVPSPLHSIRISQAKLLCECVCMCVLRDGNSLDLVILLEWVKFPEEEAAELRQTDSVLPPSTHTTLLHTCMYAHSGYRALCLFYSHSPHAHTLDCTAAENVFLISGPFSLFHSFLPSSPYVIT